MYEYYTCIYLDFLKNQFTLSIQKYTKLWNTETKQVKLGPIYALKQITSWWSCCEVKYFLKILNMFLMILADEDLTHKYTQNITRKIIIATPLIGTRHD